MNKTSANINRLREKSTFKIELNLDTPLCNHNNIKGYIIDIVDNIRHQLEQNHTFGLIDNSDIHRENIIEGSWAIENEEEYDPDYED